MRDEVKKAVEYERFVKSKISNSMMPIGIGLLLYIAGMISLVPVDMKDGGWIICMVFTLIAFYAVDFYMKMFTTAGEKMKLVNIFTKYQMIPVKKEFLIKGKVYLLTRFVVRCTIVFQGINLVMRVITDEKIVCFDTILPTLMMLVIYIFQRIQLHMRAREIK